MAVLVKLAGPGACHGDLHACHGVLPLPGMVILGLMATDRRAVRAGHVRARWAALVRLLQVGLLNLFAFSFISAAGAT